MSSRRHEIENLDTAALDLSTRPWDCVCGDTCPRCAAIIQAAHARIGWCQTRKSAS